MTHGCWQVRLVARRFVVALAFALALMGCGVCHAETPQRGSPALPPSTTPSTRPALVFMRYVSDRAAPAFQTALVRFHHVEKGVDVTLVSAVHVGDKAYFAALNDRFARYDAVLFEMVKPDGAPMPTAAEMKARKPSGWVGRLQGGMKTVLDLAYQLEEVDYTRDNFIHADLTAEQFEQMQEERGETVLGTMLSGSFRQMMSGENMGGLTDTTGLEILAALAAPDRPRQLKLVMARQLADSEKYIEKMEGKTGSVLLTERNKAAIAIMRDQIARGKKNLAIFYGGAHLKGMAQMLEADGFTQAGDAEWLTAWDLKAPATQPAK